jgi:hypothetical protein
MRAGCSRTALPPESAGVTPVGSYQLGGPKAIASGSSAIPMAHVGCLTPQSSDRPYSGWRSASPCLAAAMNAAHSEWVKTSCRPARSLERRSLTLEGPIAHSRQSPSPLKLLLRQWGGVSSSAMLTPFRWGSHRWVEAQLWSQYFL